MSKKELERIKKLEILKRYLELEEEKEKAKRLGRELKLKKLELIERILDKGDPTKQECYCCKERASKIIEGFNNPNGLAYLCKTCFSLLVEQKDIEGFMKHLVEKNIEVFQIYPSDLADSERPYYFRFKKKEGKE